MKQIMMVMGMGINERGWAKIISQYGRVTLIQLGVVEHVEIWEQGKRVYDGPQSRTVRHNKWDQASLGLATMFRAIQLARHHSKGVKIDILLAGLHSGGLAGLWLRRLGECRRVISFLADYLPPRGPWTVRVHRRLTGWLVQWIAKHSDEAWTISPRIRVASPKPPRFVMPICVGQNPSPAGPREEIGYIGFPSPDHALDVLFDICKRHSLRPNIIGDSPYLQSIKHLAPPGTAFHGLLNDEEKIGEAFKRCFCGYAIYRDTGPTSYSYYGFPSKTLYCFASNVPIVITNVAHFNETFERRGVGRVVEPVPEQIEKAILQIKANYPAYSAAIDRFRSEWNEGVEAFYRERLAVLLAP
jgi:glycosyltransferase involved in cell wall biosynthesis